MSNERVKKRNARKSSGTQLDEMRRLVCCRGWLEVRCIGGLILIFSGWKQAPALVWDRGQRRSRAGATRRSALRVVAAWALHVLRGAADALIALAHQPFAASAVEPVWATALFVWALRTTWYRFVSFLLENHGKNFKCWTTVHLTLQHFLMRVLSRVSVTGRPKNFTNTISVTKSGLSLVLKINFMPYLLTAWLNAKLVFHFSFTWKESSD